MPGDVGRGRVAVATVSGTDVSSNRAAVDVSHSDAERGSLVPEGGERYGRQPRGQRPSAVQYAYRGVLPCATTRTDGDDFDTGATDGATDYRAGSRAMALAGSSGTAGGRHDCGEPDTPANQAAYPQPRSQKRGLGFPLCRMVGILCLGSGAVLNAAIGRYQGKGGDEQTLLRSILETLERGDLLVGDAFYATYFLLCTLRELGIDAVFEQYGARRRRTDFRCGWARVTI